MKKLIALALCVCMSASLVACGSSSSSNETAPSSAPAASEAAPSEAASEAPAAPAAKDAEAADVDASEMKIAMVTDSGDITDQSFNQNTYESCKAWAEKNGADFTYYKPEGDSTSDRVAMMERAIEDGYTTLVLPGYLFAEAIVEIADENEDVKFVGLDITQGDLDGASSEEGYKRDNVFCAAYKGEISGYLAGQAAVKMGYTKLGFLGGMAVPGPKSFGYGFVQGADDAAKELGADVEIKYAYANQFYGDSDITAVMDTWCQNGTEAIFACGGGVWTSAAEAAVKTEGKIIGVDVDQAPVIDGKYGDGITITSALKGLQPTVNTILNAIAADEWTNYGGQTQTLGLVSADDLDSNYVGIASSTQWTDGFKEDDLKALVKKIYDGEITVNYDSEAEEPSANTATLDFQGNLK